MNYQVECAKQIQTDAATLSTLVKDLTRWKEWSPWLCCDPEAQVSFAEDNTIQRWKSDVVGEGEMEKIASQEHEQTITLRFFKPFKSTAKATISWLPQGNSCYVTWTMSGSMPLFLAWMIPMMKGWITMDYRRGLNRLGYLAETGSVPATLTFDSQTKIKRGYQFIGLARKKIHAEAMAETMERDGKVLRDVLFPLLGNAQMLSIIDKASITKNTFDYSFGVAYEGDAPALPSGQGWVCKTVHEHKVVTVRLDGPYDCLGDAWSMAMMGVKAAKLQRDKKTQPSEVYILGPHNSQKNAVYQTVIEMPVR